MSIAEAWQITDQYLIMNLNRSCCSSTLARCFTMFHPSSATPHTCNFFMNSETRKKSRTTKHPDHTNGKITILTIPPGNSCTKPIMHLSRSFHLVCRLDLELWLHRSISIGCHRCHQCHLGQGDQAVFNIALAGQCSCHTRYAGCWARMVRGLLQGIQRTFHKIHKTRTFCLSIGNAVHMLLPTVCPV